MFSDDDLKFTLTPETDLDAIERYLAQVEKMSAEAGKEAGQELSKAFAASIPKNVAMPKTAVDSTDLILRSRLLSQLADQLKQQRALLEKADAAPIAGLEKRLELAKEISAVQPFSAIDENAPIEDLAKRLNEERQATEKRRIIVEAETPKSVQVPVDIAQAPPVQPPTIPSVEVPVNTAAAPEITAPIVPTAQVPVTTAQTPPVLPPVVPTAVVPVETAQAPAVQPPTVPQAQVPIGVEPTPPIAPPAIPSITVPVDTAKTPEVVSPAAPSPVQIETTTAQPPPIVPPAAPPVTIPVSVAKPPQVVPPTVPTVEVPTTIAPIPATEPVQPAPTAATDPLAAERLRVERDIAEVMRQQAQVSDQLKETGVPPGLVLRRRELELITKELVKQHEAAVKVEQEHQSQDQSNKTISDDAAAEASRKRLETERLIAEAQRQQADVEAKIQNAWDNGPLETRRRIVDDLTAKLKQQEDLLKRTQHLSDPKHVEEEVALRLKLLKVQQDAAAAEAKRAAAVSAGVGVEVQEVPEAVDLHKELYAEITKELKLQTRELEKQRVAMDPELVKRRLDLEKESADVAHQQAVDALKQKLDPAEMEKRIRQEKELAELQRKVDDARTKAEKKVDGGFDLRSVLTSINEGGLVEGLKTAVKGALSGIDIPKLLAGTLGAFNASGTKAAAGAAVGGVAGAKVSAVREEATPTAQKPPQETVQEPRPEPRAERGDVSPVPQVQPVKNAKPDRFPTVPAGRRERQEEPNRIDLSDLTKKIGDVFSKSAPKRAVPMVQAEGAEAASAATPVSGQAIGEVAGAAATGGAEAAGGAALGMAAEAAAGPIGLAVMAVQALAKVSGQVAAMPFKAVNAGLSAITVGLNGMADTLGPVGAGLDLMGAGLEKLSEGIESIPLLGDLLGPLTRQLALMPGLVKDITESLASFAAKASPAAFHMLTMAVDDAQAAIGQAFLPIMEMLTDAIRLGGDILATILPNYQEMTAALSDVRAALAPVAATLRQAFAEVGPQLRGQFMDLARQLGEALATITSAIGPRAVTMLATIGEQLFNVAGVFLKMAEYLTPLAVGLMEVGQMLVDLQVLPFLIGTVVGAIGVLTAALFVMLAPLLLLASPLILVALAIKKVVDTLRSAGILSTPTADTTQPGRSASGLAARQANMQGIDEYQRQLQIAAFSQGGGPTQADLPTQVAGIGSTLTSLLRLFEGLISGDAMRVLLPSLSTAPGARPPDPLGVGQGASGQALDSLGRWLNENFGYTGQ